MRGFTRRARRAGWPGALLALALLAAQTLALLHGLLHLPDRDLAASSPALERWVGHHAPGSLACHALDQLAKADATGAAAALVPVLPSSEMPDGPLRHGMQVAHMAAYRARAPPSIG